jgi:light-regulated signal transduction histidine kinase (bacteriophytochrome)
MQSVTDSYPTQNAVGLDECAREPIHIPGSIQPHGALIAARLGEGIVEHVSANAEAFFAESPEGLLGKPILEVVPESGREFLEQALREERLTDRPSLVADYVSCPHGPSSLLAHQHEGLLFVELESRSPDDSPDPDDLFSLLAQYADRLGQTSTERELLQVAAEEVQRQTGFDRALVYRFAGDEHGTVLAEVRNERLPSYMNQRFPASDIPPQARELYRVNRVRLIPTADYEPAPIRPAQRRDTGAPVDLRFAALRSVSPVHLEYMRNMRTASSFSTSIVVDGQLWGLISCHHASPRGVSFPVRAACDVLTQMLSWQITARERVSTLGSTARRKSLHTSLLTNLGERADWRAALQQLPQPLLELTDSQGVALVEDEEVWQAGTTPSAEQTLELAKWLDETADDEPYATDKLGTVFPAAAAYAEQASGVLSLELSRYRHSRVLWFRPELIETVEWAGDPRKITQTGPERGRIHPRQSFAAWQELVRGRSAPWEPAQVEAATDFRAAVVNVILRRAEELAALTSDLQRANRELEAFSYTVSHDLRAPFRHITGYSQLLKEREGERLSDTGKHYLQCVVESAEYAGRLVDYLLSFAQVGRTALRYARIDMRVLFDETLRDLRPDIGDRKVDWRVGLLPKVWADPILMKLVMQNLLSNALKFTQRCEVAEIGLQAVMVADQHVFSIRDNGVGFDMRYVDKLFGMFQRLHRMEEFEGTGVGLAHVRRIIERHRGRTWAESTVGEGATFFFSLPVKAENPNDA